MTFKFLLIAAFSVAIGLPAFAAGDPAQGQAVFKRCAICHSNEKGVNRIGPSLWGVVGRHSGSLSDFNYSDAMKAANKVWDEPTLDAYLKDPQASVPGNRMGFPGLPDADQRKNLIAYLATLK